MNCVTCQESLGRCFDTGEIPQGPVEQHLRTCEACAAFQAQLADLDGLLAMPVAVETDEVFVARVQAAVALSSRVPFPHWARVAVVLGITLAALGGGWMLDGVIYMPVSDLGWSQPDLSSLPTGQQMATQFTMLPETMLSLLMQIPGALMDGAEGAADSLRGPLDQHGAIVWAAGIVGVIVLLLVNTRERGHLA